MDIAKRLRRKFVIIAMGSVTMVLALIVGSINVVAYLGVIERTEARLDLLERQLGSPEQRGALAQTPPAGPTPPGISPETPFDMRFFTVTIDAKENVASTDMSNIAAVTEQQATQMATETRSSRSPTGFSSSYRYRAIPLDSAGAASEGGDTQNEATIYLFLDCSRELGQFGTLLKASAAMSGVGLVLVGALVTGLSGVAIRPIAESYRKQRRFVTDASHELKTPLSVIDANAEVIEMTSGESEWTQSIHGQVARMAELTDRLVFLARMDEGDELTMTDCNLSELVERTIEPYRAVALAANKRLSVSIEPHMRCRAHAPSIAQALCLLLDNAMRYARKGSVVEVSVRAHGSIRRIEVSNTCDDPPTGDLDILFERFYRSDESRTRATGGSGVGLAVVRAIAEAHHGTATCTMSDGETIRFSLTIRS